MSLFFIDPQACEGIQTGSYERILLRSLAICLFIGLATDFAFMFHFDPTTGVPGQPLSAFMPFFELAGVGVLMIFSLMVVEPLLERSAERGFFGYGAALSAGALIGSLMGFAAALFFLMGVPFESGSQRLLFAAMMATHGAIVFGIPSAVLVWSGLSRAFPSIEQATVGKLVKFRVLFVLFPFFLLPLWQVTFWPYFLHL